MLSDFMFSYDVTWCNALGKYRLHVCQLKSWEVGDMQN